MSALARAKTYIDNSESLKMRSTTPKAAAYTAHLIGEASLANRLRKIVPKFSHSFTVRNLDGTTRLREFVELETILELLEGEGL